MRATSRMRRLGFESLESRLVLSPVVPVDLPTTTHGVGPAVSALESSAKAGKGGTTADWSYSVVGNAADKITAPDPGVALMGGGADVDAAFAWLGSRANGGDVVVLGVSKTSYANYIYNLTPGLDSVAMLVVPTRTAANAEFVYQTVAGAEAIFIVGGDQANYVTNWDETRLEEAIYAALEGGAAIGGTSAGLAVLGDVDFASHLGTITSTEALANPLDPRIDLDYGDFLTPDETFVLPDERVPTALDCLNNIITDSHFMQRDRFGRTMAFMANADSKDLLAEPARAIAVNEQTALLIAVDRDYPADLTKCMVTVVGNPIISSKKLSPDQQQRSVYLLQAQTTVTKSDLEEPLNYIVTVQRLNYTPGDALDWVSLAGLWADTSYDYTVTADHGSLLSSSGSLYGSVLSSSRKA